MGKERTQNGFRDLELFGKLSGSIEPIAYLLQQIFTVVRWRAKIPPDRNLMLTDSAWNNLIIKRKLL
mgnify:CR=1 FL=1